MTGASKNTIAKLLAEVGDACSKYQNETIRGVRAKRVQPDAKHISTSYVEGQNLAMRMSMRRFTRLTNAFSKKLENHGATVALHFMYYNFGGVHQTLRMTPAMGGRHRRSCVVHRGNRRASAVEGIGIAPTKTRGVI